MAADQYTELIKLGPFLGIDVGTAEPYVTPGFGVDAINVNCARMKGALMPERGRTQIANFSPQLASINVVVSCIGAANTPYFLVQGFNASNVLTTLLMNASTGAITTVSGALQFTQAVQYGQVIYTNGGQRFFIAADITKMYYWQYLPASNTNTLVFSQSNAVATTLVSGPITVGDTLTTTINGTGVTYTVVQADAAGGLNVLMQHIATAINANATVGALVTAQFVTSAFGTQNAPLIIISANNPGTAGNAITLAVSTSGGATETYTASGAHLAGANSNLGNITPGVYFYVFTQVTTMPDGSTSETSVYPAQFANPFFINIVNGGTNAITINDSGVYKFTGTNADGTTYTTNIYRQSSNQAGYFLVGNASTNAAFVDTFPDYIIAQNAMLAVHRDVPPLGTGGYPINYAFLAVHKNRVWVFATVQPAGNFGLPQVQLWYSNFARPWEFDDVNQVLLLESDVDSTDQTFGTYTSVYGNDPKGLAVVGTQLVAFKKHETWVVYGDNSPGGANPFIQRQLFTIGAVSTGSITPAVGGVFWLSEHGVYFFDGSAPQYDTKRITSYLRSVPLTVTAASVTDQAASTGFFAGLCWYLSFPTLGYTLIYDTVGGEWVGRLPYATQSAYAIDYTVSAPASNYQNLSANTGSFNEVVVARGTFLDHWLADPNLDLGNAQTCSFAGAQTDSGQSSYEKQYRYVTLLAPIQNAVAIVTLNVDNGVSPAKIYTVQFDLSGTGAQSTWQTQDRQTPRHIAAIGDGSGGILRGYLASLTVFVTGTGSTAPQVWSASVWGQIPPDRNLVMRT
jgi:hypothetical protein